MTIRSMGTSSTQFVNRSMRSSSTKPVTYSFILFISTQQIVLLHTKSSCTREIRRRFTIISKLHTIAAQDIISKSKYAE